MSGSEAIQMNFCSKERTARMLQMKGGCPDKGHLFSFFLMNIFETVTAYTNYVTKLKTYYIPVLQV
jgi:hypothetical protein